MLPEPDLCDSQKHSLSDYQAEFFKAKRLGNVKKLKYNTRKWNHVAELLDFFQTFVGFKHYQEIRQDIIEQSRKEDIVMDSVFYSIFDEAWDKGIEKGYEEGIEKGIEKGIAKGISALTETYQELHRTKEELQAKLIEKFDLTEEQAKGYIQQYWA